MSTSSVFRGIVFPRQLLWVQGASVIAVIQTETCIQTTIMLMPICFPTPVQCWNHTETETTLHNAFSVNSGVHCWWYGCCKPLHSLQDGVFKWKYPNISVCLFYKIRTGRRLFFMVLKENHTSNLFSDTNWHFTEKISRIYTCDKDGYITVQKCLYET